MKNQPHHQARHPLSHRYDSDPPMNPLPHEPRASHLQGNHPAEYARKHGLGDPMQKRDRAKVHSSEKM